MAHHLPHQQAAAIFSPSVARAAASTAKDWSYVDSWLRSKYGKNKIPPFERNPDTLKALLALAAANEAADDDRDQLARLEEAALDEVRRHERETEEQRRRQQQQTQTQQDTADAETEAAIPDGATFAADLLAAIESNLSKDGSVALSAMSSMALALGTADPSPSSLGASFVSLQAQAASLEDALARVGLLQQYLDREALATQSFLDELQRDGPYQLAPDLAKQNLELQRRVRAMASRLPELRQHVLALEKAVGPPGITVDDVRRDEETYLDLLARKKDLDARVDAFAGLPPDLDAARAELEALRTQLRGLTEQRDANFERLVERESPVKSRRRP
ncbi:hypothetical protein AAE478_010562 [Parahypoxylon ruwenzoriense]